MTEQRNHGRGYALGESDSFTAELQSRGVFDYGFFTRRLQPGMRLLDLGCGPGPVTLELASMVAPGEGEVVGVDSDPMMIERARALASERGVTNARFELGNASEPLPFDSASFDAAYSQLVFLHLHKPVETMREVRRVLRPGGMFGVVDSDNAFYVMEPESELLKLRAELAIRYQAYMGGDLFFGRKHRHLLLEAGFNRAEQIARLESFTEPERLRGWARFRETLTRAQAKTYVDEGWATPEQVAGMLDDLKAWAERPDAFATTGLCVSVGFVDG